MASNVKQVASLILAEFIDHEVKKKGNNQLQTTNQYQSNHSDHRFSGSFA